MQRKSVLKWSPCWCRVQGHFSKSCRGFAGGAVAGFPSSHRHGLGSIPAQGTNQKNTQGKRAVTCRILSNSCHTPSRARSKPPFDKLRGGTQRGEARCSRSHAGLKGTWCSFYPAHVGVHKAWGPRRGLGVATDPPRQHRQLAEPLQSPFREGRWGSVRKEGRR